MAAQDTVSISSVARDATAARDILGVRVEPLSLAEAVDVLQQRIREHRFTRVGFLNAHSANVASSRADYSEALQGFLVLPDGVGVDIASAFLHGVNFPANLNGTDFVPAFLMAQTKPIKVGLIGTTRQNAEGAAQKLHAVTPRHEIMIIADGFFAQDQEHLILGHLRKVRPDVLLVGMGVPRQELWISRNLSGEHCTIAFAVGGLLDFMSGAVPRAPHWVRQVRLEWLFRLAQEPGRLWRRYILGNPVFLLRVLRQKLAGERRG